MREPVGTRWSNPLGGWTQGPASLSTFHPERPYVISCYGPEEAKRLSVDIARPPAVADGVIEFVDLYLDRQIDPHGVVSEKDEDQLAALEPTERDTARAARDEVRWLIAAGDPLFDARGPDYRAPAGARALPPLAA